MDKNNIKRDFLWRIYLIYFFILLFAGFIIARVVKIQIAEGAYWKERAQQLTLHYANIEALRGNIFDVNGQLLATSVPYYDVAVDINSEAIPDKVFEENVDSLSLSLANLFPDKTRAEYKRILIHARVTSDRYLLLRRNVTYKELDQLKNFPLFRKGRYKGGLLYTQKGKRELPFKFLAARTIGYNTGNSQPVGIEGSYHRQLTGIGGKRLVRKIAGGVEVPVNDENEIEPQDGCDLISTIDIHIQDVAEHALYEQLKKNRAAWGTVILMEVKTGEIRAIANLARVDSTRYGEKFNYAIAQSTEPGSTFKLASLMAAMEDGYVNWDDTVETGNGSYYFFNQEMKDAHSGGYGKLTVKQAFEKSSNVGVSKIIYNCYSGEPQRFIDRLFAMGLNLSPQLDIPGAVSPKIKTTKSKYWSRVSLPWMSIGYELSLTPLQVLTFYNAVANDGVMVKPHFVREIRKQGKVIKSIEPEIIHPRIASASTIKKAREMMEGVVQNGTAKNLNNTDYRIAGKTGTAQIAKDKSGYGKESKSVTYQASFVGYFPADNPKYSCMVVVDAPSEGVYYGNQVAGPIFREISDRVYSSCLEIHNRVNETKVAAAVSPSVKNGYRKDIEIICKELSVPITTGASSEYATVVSENDSSLLLTAHNINRLLDERKMPDVVGMGLKDALFLLENAGLKVKVSGKGAIVRQSIPAGAKFSKGMELFIELL